VFPQEVTFWAMRPRCVDNSCHFRVDHERIKDVGAERACAEWLLRCGAEVRWKGSNKFHKDYNSLPPEGLHKFVIEEINADEAALMEIGFPHFGKLNYGDGEFRLEIFYY